MKKLNLVILFLLCIGVAQAQDERPVENRNTKSNINTTNNNSNSGVNPNGNPGTIISNSAISGGNPPSNISPYTPTPPSQYYNEPEVRNAIREENKTEIVEQTPVKAPTPTVNSKPKAIAEHLEVVEIKRVNTLGGEMKVVNIQPIKKQNFRPVYQTYIPQNIVDDIKKKFGDNVYDIILLNSKTGKQVYIVRVMENGVFRTETLTY